MQTISGYKITEQISANQHAIVYRGQHPITDESAIIKIARSKYPSLTQLAAFRNHFTLTRNLNCTGVVRALQLEQYGKGYALLLEDVGALSLSTYLRQVNTPPSTDKPINIFTKDDATPLLEETSKLGLDLFFSIALQLVDILDSLYRHRIIHRGITPENILLNPHTDDVFLTGFSIASRLPNEMQMLRSPHALEGDLAYMSPEQTGRMNRGIDYRSDFYALGVSFFELLTGQLPFQSTDPMTLMHCHMAVPAPLAHTVNPAISRTLASLIVKLMAKNPDERYQSTVGLKHDLQVCQTQWQHTGKIELFPVGQHDISDQFTLPGKLYGRNNEVQQLLEAFDQAAQGERTWFLIAGHSGIGKTAVVNEVHKPIARQQGYFIRGKFDQFQRDIPLSGFVQALNDLVAQLLSESNEAIADWKKRILTVLGDNGQLILEMLPQLAQIIGPQPVVSEIFGSATQERFNRLLKTFIQLFAEPNHPLVIFLDDLQWADTASLQFLRLVLDDADIHHLLIIGTYRDNEVSLSHPLSFLIDDLIQYSGLVQILSLNPLHEEDLNQLVADTLSCSLSLAMPLGQLLRQKTNGNPFFAIQFLQALYDRQLLTYNPIGGYWQFDIAQVRALSTTNDIVSLMVYRLQQLPQKTQQLISLAACLGNQFDLLTLALVNHCSVSETANTLWQALNMGLILPLSEIYRFFQGSENANDTTITSMFLDHEDSRVLQYRFLHDRVRQAAYSLIPTEQLAATHLGIGQCWLAHLNAHEQENHIFELVRHFNIGYSDDSQAIATDQIAQLNLMAGKRAKASVAYDSAIAYYQTTRTYLNHDSWDKHYELTFETHFEILEVEYLLGHYEVSEDMAYGILPHLRTTLDSAKIYNFLVCFYSAQNRLAEAIQKGLKGLKFLKIPLSEDSPLKQVIPALPLPNQGQVAALPTMTNPIPVMGLKLLMNLCTPCYASDTSLYRRVVFTMLHLCQKYGYAAPAAHAYASYAMTLCCDAHEFDLGYQAGQVGLYLVGRFNAKALGVKVNLLCNGQIHHWTRHLAETIHGLETGIMTGIDVHDIEFATYCLNFLYLHTSRTTDAIDMTLAYQAKFLDLREIKRYEKGTTLFYSRIWHQYLLTLAHPPPNDQQELGARPLVGIAFDEIIALPQLKEMEARVSLVALYLVKTMLAYIFECYDEALTWAQFSTQYLTGLSSTLVPLHNAYYSLALLASIEFGGARDKRRIPSMAQVEQNQQLLRQWAHSAPMNYGHLYRLVEAEEYRIRGQVPEAMTAYDDAIAQAETNQYLGDQALAYEQAAKFYLALNKPLIAQTYGMHSYYSYVRWGARTKVIHLETHNPQLLDPTIRCSESTSSRFNSHQSPRLTNPTSEQLDLETLMQASRLLSQEIQIDQLLAALLKVLRENTGAEKCVLMLTQGHQLLIKAQSSHQKCQLLNQPVESSQKVPLGIINYVAHTQQAILRNSATTEPHFANDPYIQKYQSQSILCSPILNQGKLIGIVYLENSLASNMFTDERLEVIHLICAQASISLENAALYTKELNFQQELRNKNLALEDAIKKAEIAQNKLAQLNRNLEHKIQLRTEELERANQILHEQITERQCIQKQLKEREAQFASILNSLEEVVWSVSAQTGKVLYLNPAAEKVYGRPLPELLGNPDAWKQAMHPDDRTIVEEKFSSLLDAGELHIEYRILKPDREVRWLTDYAQVIYKDNKPIRIDHTLSDITQRKQAENQLLHDAMHDKLTGLPNRALLINRLEIVLKHVQCDSNYTFAVLFIDFDRFKVINDSLGHLVGDHLLVYCAQILKQSIREQDIIARLGGDEFVILLDNIETPESTAIDVAQRIHQHFKRKILIDNHTIFTSASIGIVLGTADYIQASDILQDADIAMYRAKANGRACYEIFTPMMRVQALEILHSGNALRLALENEEFSLYYQPILSLKEQQFVGIEALIRWRHPERGILSPHQFIPIALESDLMVPIGFWVLRTACYQIKSWYDTFSQDIPLKMSINVSEPLICEPRFLEYFDIILKETGISPQSLCLELVEDTLMSEHKDVRHILDKLQQRQISLAIDDFGTGYSSLSYLHRLPINYLKIDHSFVRHMSHNHESFEIIRTIVTLANALGKTVIAEGIETIEQVHQLKMLGCELGQGFFFSRPLSVEDLEKRFLQHLVTEVETSD